MHRESQGLNKKEQGERTAKFRASRTKQSCR